AAFIDALHCDGKAWLLADDAFAVELAQGHVPDPDIDVEDDGTGSVPVLLAVSDNGPQMTSSATARFMAAARIGQHFGRPGTPNDQAWIESFFGHLKAENPHLDAIADPGALRAELDHLCVHYNTVRLHESIGYVTPQEEHEGRGPAIRKARQDGLKRAREARIATRRQTRHNHTNNTSTDEGI
ncbi:integrase core domain-containing protein, partial [Actinomyces provencensis]